MFYAQITKDAVRFHAFETERAAGEWIIAELGGDYANDFWIDDDGILYQSSRSLDFGATIHTCLQSAVEAQALLDPDAAIIVLRALCDAIEQAPEE
jgi:hypothetical protein